MHFARGVAANLQAMQHKEKTGGNPTILEELESKTEGYAIDNENTDVQIRRPPNRNYTVDVCSGESLSWPLEEPVVLRGALMRPKILH